MNLFIILNQAVFANNGYASIAMQIVNIEIIIKTKFDFFKVRQIEKKEIMMDIIHHLY